MPMKEKTVTIRISKSTHRAIREHTSKQGMKLGQWAELKLQDALGRCGGYNFAKGDK